MPYGKDFLDAMSDILGDTRPARNIGTRCSQCDNMTRDGINWFNEDKERGDTKEMCFSCRNAKLVDSNFVLFPDVRKWRIDNDPDFDIRYE
jgi:hypothetical protein